MLGTLCNGNGKVKVVLVGNTRSEASCKEERSTTIPNGSTFQVYGNGNAAPLTSNVEGEDIV